MWFVHSNFNLAMSLVPYYSLLLIICALVGIKAQQSFDPCTCPCRKIIPVQVDPYLKTNANCVYIKSVYSKGLLFTSDVVIEGSRYVFHDVSHYKTAKPNYSHTAFWKIFYPWRNVSNTADVPLAVQNILSSEFMVVSHQIVEFTNRQIVTHPVLTIYSLWHFTYPGGYYKIMNQFTKEYLFSDEQHKSGWNEGKVFTDTIKRSSSDDFPGKYGFHITPCYE
uniref:Putative aaegsfp4 n=1 Tax=Aedes albopictus TaxID=7160 RepID=A0A023EK14_AEDAL